MEQSEARDRLHRALMVMPSLIIGGMDPDDLLRAAGYVRVEDIAGITEVAEALHIAINAADNRRRRDPSWPAPIAELASGRIYDLSTVPGIRADAS